MSIKKIPKNIKLGLLMILVLVVLVEGVVYLIFLNNRATSTYIVELRDDGSYPKELTITKGDTVVFRTTRDEPFWPASNLHPTHIIYPEFDPKKAIQPGESWQFRFDKVGRWKYHDHLSPNFTGTIIVSDKDNAQKKEILASATECEGVNISQKQKCWDEQLELTIRNKGLDAAFKLFIELYQTDPSIPKACHGWAHILGKAAYELFHNNKDFILKKETSYCGYGFFHGFIEKLLQETGNLKATREFCDYASKQLKDQAPGVYRNCLHGIGHGSVEVDDPKLWGNFQAMLDKGLKTCGSSLIEEGELRECFDGAFNAMQQYALHEEYKLSLNRSDLFKICREQQQEQHKDSCYYEFTGVIGEVVKHDFKKAVDLVLKDISGKNFTPRIIMKLSADFFQTDIAKDEYSKNVFDCRALSNDDLYMGCFNGILLGFIAHGEPERQYVKGLEFCRSSLLKDKEIDRCYQWILGQTVKKDSSVCASVEEKYRRYCNG